MATPTVTLANLVSAHGQLFHKALFVNDPSNANPFRRLSDAGHEDVIVINLAAWLDLGDTGLMKHGGLVTIPSVQVIEQAIAIAGFTDNAGTATGYIDLADELPAGAIPLGWLFVGTGAFAGDSSAVMQVGEDGGDLDRFGEIIDQSVFAAATVGSRANVQSCDDMDAAQTIRVTVTGGADFTSIVTDGNGAGTLYVYYLKTE